MSQPAVGAGLAPLSSARYLLGPREWMLVERFEKRAAQAARIGEQASQAGREPLALRMASESKTWRQAAQIVREELSRVDIDLRDPTVFAMLEGVVTR